MYKINYLKLKEVYKKKLFWQAKFYKLNEYSIKYKYIHPHINIKARNGV